MALAAAEGYEVVLVKEEVRSGRERNENQQIFTFFVPHFFIKGVSRIIPHALKGNVILYLTKHGSSIPSYAICPTSENTSLEKGSPLVCNFNAFPNKLLYFLQVTTSKLLITAIMFKRG